MRWTTVYLLMVSLLTLCTPYLSRGQDFSFNCTRDTVISGCASSSCFSLRTLLPDVRAASSTYTVNPIPNNGGTCLPVYSNPAAGGIPAGIVADDTYSGVITLDFQFPFFGDLYQALVVSSNGAVSFNVALAGGAAHYGLFNAGGVLGAVGTPEDLPSMLYDRALIMGPYHDMDITINSSPNRRIQHQTVGAAPNRKWILSFFEIPLYNCNNLFRNTHQIILNEATGIIEVLVFSKQNCTNWNSGRAMIGIQNILWNQAVMAPGRRASDPPWGSVNMNEGWRFVPSAGASLFRRAELYVLGNSVPEATLLPANVTASNGNLELVFPDVCPPAGTTTTYVVKSVYAKHNDANTEVAGFDTIRVTRATATDLDATATTTASACGTSGNGSISVTVPAGNGTGNFQYSLTSAAGPWQTGNVFQDLQPGDYTVYVSDLGGACTSTVPVTVASTGRLQATYTTTATSCAGAGNGAITIEAGSSPTLEYQINGGLWQSSNVFTGLQGGFYFVNVRDQATGCTSNTLTITVPSGTATVTGTAAGTPTSCAGAANGAITVTPNGTGPFEYSLNNGTWSNSSIFNDLPAGNYTVRIREAGVCVSEPIAVAVASGSGLSPVITTSPTSCQGQNNGVINITLPAGTTAPYTVVLDGTTHVISNTTATFNGISAGTHTITVSDATGCSTSNPVSVVVVAGPGFTASATPTPTSCAGVNDGTISILPQGAGSAPYTVVLSPGGTSLSGTGPFNFTGLAPGNYSVLLTDNSGCQFSIPQVSVTAGTGLSVTATPVNTTCTGINNGTIAVTSNGTAPFTFVLNGTVTLNSPTPTATFQNVAAGSHSITVTDAAGCATTNPVEVVVGAGSGFTASYAVTPVRCAGGVDGNIAIDIETPGTAPYTFVLNGTVTQAGPQGTSFTGLPAGNYSVLLTDAAGCTYTFSDIIVQEPPALAATASVQAVSCNGASDGRITVNVTGGTGSYSYSLDNTTFQAGNQFNVAAGTYTVYVADANNCQVPVAGIVVAEPPVLQAQITVTADATCEGGADGRLEVNATGGTAPYSYSVNGGSGFQSSNVLLVTPGTYTVIVRDANNCEVTTTAATVGLTNTLTFTPLADPQPVCQGTGVPVEIITNGNQFSWTPAEAVSNAAIANPVLSPETTTTFQVTIGLGQCTVTSEVTVTIMPAPVASAGADATICAGQSYQLQGSGGLSYNWTPAVHLSDPQIANPVVNTPASTTAYNLTVTDANNCSSLQPDQMVLTVTPPIRIQTSPADTVVFPGAQVELLASSPATSYTWMPALYLNNPSIANPLFTAPGVGEVVTYVVTGTTDAGCRGEGTVTLRVYDGPDLYVPNAFTPNNDGRNDVFFPFPVGVKKLDYFRVYNRWGQLIFNTSTLGAGWNGQSSGQDQPAGVYIWQVQAVMEGNITIRKQGTVVLIR